MNVLLSEIAKETVLTKAEEDLIKSVFTVKKLRKRQFLVQQDASYRHLYFIEKGIVRSYIKGPNDEEHIVQFAAEGSWISEDFNQLADIKSVYNIDALEPSEILCIDREVFQNLMVQIPKLERYFRMVLQKRLYALNLRVLNYLMHFAEEKYRRFVSFYPEIVQRVPQHMIAAYLGIKPETLSRNRKKMATKKKEA
ncbi:Crp/Fnr family transcriptional regulator [Taibaiella lutea]|uniref:Crp/Fnr family transcriptional regulator n=1 Tax=Taibaiella lutea TaxID=2608001 RepID=A0A5M6CHS1_9BACT|nr:Crp/Fnr family transcriptional regulator [Taibaiella lutea]KAA5533492.1 Crp/Fnr family transcriptional regulator [Taibaiella lutea]